MTTILLTTEPTSLRQVSEFAAAAGLEPTDRAPWSNGIRQVTWGQGERVLTLGMHASSGAGLLIVGDPTGALVEQLREAIPCESDAEALQRARAATTPRDRIRQSYRLSTLLLANRLDPEPLLDFIGEQLLDDEPLVRWAAARILRFRFDRHTEALLGRAAEQHPELASVHAQVVEACVANEDGTLYDEPTDSWWELIRRAREGIAAGQWTRVERSADALLDDRCDHAEGLLLRGLAYEHAGEPLMALALVGAAQGELRSHASDDDNDDDDDNDELGKSDDEKARERQALIEEIAQVRPRIESAADQVTEAQREAMEEFLSTWFQRWDDRSTPRAGAASLLVERLPALTGVLALLAGRYDDDLALLRRAVDLVPDAPECRVDLAHALRRTGDTADAEAIYRDALERLAVPVEERSADARRIDAWTRESVRESTVAHVLTELSYDAERWDEAAELADRLVQLDPDDATGWQIRANARTFGGRLEDAAVAYGEAIEALDRYSNDPDSIYFGADPRPLMRFNRASVLAKLGRNEQSLEQLRHAVRADDTWGPKAQTDDFFEQLWADEEFLAIVAAAPKALILEEEKDPEYLEALVSRCMGHSHMGRVDEAIETCHKTVELAKLLGQPGALARVHSVWARTLAMHVDPEQALEHSASALALLEHVPAEERGEIVHTHGLVHHYRGQLDEAEQAYLRAQALRAEVMGDDHPVLGKSYGDLARLATDRGDPPQKVMELTRTGLALLDRYIERHGDELTDVVREAELDAAILQVNIGHTRAQSDDMAGALEALERAAERIRTAVEHDTPFEVAFLDNATGLARSLTGLDDPTLRNRAHAVLRALEFAPLTGPPEEQEERVFWRRLANLARRLRQHGIDDAAFANAFQRAMRGELSAQELSAVPELAGLPAELATRVERYPTLLAMIAMSLSTVESGASTIDKALDDLEVICVGSMSMDEHGEPEG